MGEMKHISESIIGRKNGVVSGWPVLDKIRNPEFSDLIPYNIVKASYSEPYESKYGIVISEEEALKLFPHEYKNYKGKGGAIIFYNSVTYGNLVFITISNYSKRFPQPFIIINRKGYEITDIWDGSKYYKTFEYKLKSSNDYVEFLRQSIDNPEEFEKMLKP